MEEITVDDITTFARKMLSSQPTMVSWGDGTLAIAVLSLKYTYMLMTDRLALPILQLTKFLHMNLFTSGSSSTLHSDPWWTWRMVHWGFILTLYSATGSETTFFQKCKSLLGFLQLRSFVIVQTAHRWNEWSCQKWKFWRVCLWKLAIPTCSLLICCHAVPFLIDSGLLEEIVVTRETCLLMIKT